MKIIAPAKSSAHLVLRKACSQAGFDDMALRQLLWLINGHPLLVSHAQIFEHVGKLLQAAHQIPDIFRHPDLLDALPQWITLCQWISSERSTLARRPELALFDRQPQHTRDHPLLRQGVARHAVVAALWNRHHSVPSYPPDVAPGAGQAYFHLQLQVLASYMEARARHNNEHSEQSALEQYEHYDGESESPLAPSPTGEVGLAIRELSLASHDAVLHLLPLAQSAQGYATAFTTLSVTSSTLPGRKPGHITRYLSSLKRYFSRYAQLLSNGQAYELTRRTRTKENLGSGGHQSRPGFVNLPGIPGVLLQAQSTDDEEIPSPFDTATAFIDTGQGEEDEARSLEASGLSPTELLEPVLQLYTANELGAKLAGLRRQQLALEMQAQHLPFAYTMPTRAEVHALHAFLMTRVMRHLEGAWSNQSQSRLECIGALILLAMLVLGQPLGRIREMRFSLIDASSPIELWTDHTTVVLASTGHQSDLAVARGFWIPGIGPSYKSVLPEALARIQQPAVAPGFVLPDTLGVAALIAGFLAVETRPNDKVFGIEPATARQVVSQLFELSGLERLTPTRVARVLPSVIRGLGADATAQWVLCAETDRANEPRMFYTQLDIAALISLYQRASRRLARQLGICTRGGSVSNATEPGACVTKVVGARFVAPLDSVGQLITTLRDEIRTSRREPLAGSPLVDYHGSYTLYTWLFQTLSTSMRAVASPRANALFDALPSNKAGTFDAALSDKDDARTSRARIAMIDDSLSLQLLNYKDHVENLLQRLRPQIDQRSACAWEPFLVLDERRRIVPLTPSWVADQLARRGAPLPANFHRAFLRTQLLARGVAGEVIDAFLGHANDGESPFGRYSSFDYRLHRAVLLPALRELHAELGLVPLKSRLLHYLDRRG